MRSGLQSRRRRLPAPSTPEEIEGHRLFFANSCVNCHKVSDSVAVGVFGPDLTKLMTRQTIGAGVAPLNRENLVVVGARSASLEARLLHAGHEIA